MIYRWKNSGSVPAQVAGEAIEAIRLKRGRVYASDVVEESREDTAPLHRCFNWNDADAAERYRVSQARDLLANLIIVPVETPDAEPTRAFIAIGPDNSSNDYLPLATVMGDEELRKRALNDALIDLRRARQRYHGLKELGKVWEAVDALPAQIA